MTPPTELATAHVCPKSAVLASLVQAANRAFVGAWSLPATRRLSADSAPLGRGDPQDQDLRYYVMSARKHWEMIQHRTNRINQKAKDQLRAHIYLDTEQEVNAAIERNLSGLYHAQMLFAAAQEFSVLVGADDSFIRLLVDDEVTVENEIGRILDAAAARRKRKAAA